MFLTSTISPSTWCCLHYRQGCSNNQNPIFHHLWENEAETDWNLMKWLNSLMISGEFVPSLSCLLWGFCSHLKSEGDWWKAGGRNSASLIFSAVEASLMLVFGKIPFPFEMLLFNILELWTQTPISKDSFNIKALIRSQGEKSHQWDVLTLNGTACSKQSSHRHKPLTMKCHDVTNDGLWQLCAREARKVVRLKRRQF